MKIRIEAERCRGHQNCIRIAPPLFCVGEDGYARVVGDGDVPAEWREQARLASDNCPEFAIEIEEDSDGSDGTTARHA